MILGKFFNLSETHRLHLQHGKGSYKTDRIAVLYENIHQKVLCKLLEPYDISLMMMIITIMQMVMDCRKRIVEYLFLNCNCDQASLLCLGIFQDATVPCLLPLTFSATITSNLSSKVLTHLRVILSTQRQVFFFTLTRPSLSYFLFSSLFLLSSTSNFSLQLVLSNGRRKDHGSLFSQHLSLFLSLSFCLSLPKIHIQVK